MTKIKPLFFFFNKKILISIIIALFIISSFAFLNKVSAFSVETTGVSLNSNTSNNGVYAYIGGFDVFVTDYKILFYSPDGSLAKTYDIPVLSGNQAQITRILPFNNTHLIMATQRYYTDVDVLYRSVGYLSVSSLSYTVISIASEGCTGGSALMSSQSQVIFLNNGNIYVVSTICSVTQYNGVGAINYAVLYKITPTYSKVGIVLGTAETNIMFSGSEYVINEDSNTVYLIGRGVNSTNGILPRFNIVKLTLSTATFLNIGISPLDNLGNYVYYVDWNNTVISSNSYFDLLVGFPDNSASNTYHYKLIRFNETSVEFIAGVDGFLDYSPSQYVRVLGCRVPFGVYGNNTLTNGNYDFVYVDSYDFTNGTTCQYTLVHRQFTLSGLNTLTPSFTVSGLEVPFFIKGNGYVGHYFTSSNNLGGLLSPYGGGVMFEIDYQNSKVIGDNLMAQNPSISLVYSFSPIAISESGNAIHPQQHITITLLSGLTYRYNMILLLGGTSLGNGNYTLYSSSIGYDTTVFTSNLYNTFISNGNVNNGVLSGSFSTLILYNHYISLKFTINLDGGLTYDFYMDVTIIENNGQFPDMPTPTPSNPFGIGGSGGIVFDILTNWQNIAIIVIYTVICSLATYTFAFTGLMAGFNISTVICAIIGLLGGLLYPAIGLMVVADIAIVVMGSGLFNKTKRDMNT